MGTPSKGNPLATTPIFSELLIIFGKISAGIPNASSVGLSQSSVFRFISIVRDAFEQSVTCCPPPTPPVRFQINHVSIVPNKASPVRTASLTESAFSINHNNFRALK
uniref:Pco095943 n=1 Tax=Arundo donax TaxID=35708 RepID=A0A0A9HJZ7_ARUDO